MKAILLLLTISTCTILSFAQSTINYTFDKQGRIKSERIEGAYFLQFFYDKEGNIFFKTVDNITGSNELNASNFEEMVKVYPNPANSNVFVDISTNDTENEVILYDMLGQTIVQRVFKENRTQISLLKLKPGIYFLLIQAGSASGTYKIVKI